MTPPQAVNYKPSCSAEGYRARPRLLRSLTVLAVAWAPLRAQTVPPCAQPTIRTKDALVATLRNLHGDVESALIASLGQPVVRWSLEIATDSSSPARTAAFMVLRYARWRAAIPALTSLAQPYARPWVEWQGALRALSTYPFPELAPFWRELLHFPRRVVREEALHGLSLTGSEDDIPEIGEAFHRENNAATRRLVRQAESLLRLPPAARDTAEFAWPPDPDGRFTPSRSWLRMALESARARPCRSATGRTRRGS